MSAFPLLIVVLWAAWCPASAMAADPARTPSGKILRETYPLHTKPAEGRSLGPTPAPSLRASQVEQPEEEGSGVARLLAILLPLTLVLATVWLVRRRTNGDEPPAEAVERPPSHPPTMPSLAIFGEHDGRPASLPPDPSRRWTAEITWRRAGGESRFVVQARTAQGAAATVLTSDPMKWPPHGADDVASLQQLVSGLEATLLSAGWTALEPGETWYARRFAWVGAPEAAQRDPMAAAQLTERSET